MIIVELTFLLVGTIKAANGIGLPTFALVLLAAFLGFKPAMALLLR